MECDGEKETHGNYSPVTNDQRGVPLESPSPKTQSTHDRTDPNPRGSLEGRQYYGFGMGPGDSTLRDSYLRTEVVSQFEGSPKVTVGPRSCAVSVQSPCSHTSRRPRTPDQTYI